MNEPIIVEYAITLTQPWATLMALGEKLIETRGRRTNYRGWIAIHAAKGFPNECRALCYEAPFRKVLTDHLIDLERLPLGVVVAVTQIIGTQPTEALIRGVNERERAFGDYSIGRHGYVTAGVRRLREPIPMRGSQTIPWRMPRAITEADLI